MKEVTITEQQTAEPQQPVAEQQTVNGVNVDAYFATIDAVNADAEIAKFNFRAANKWVNGGNNRTTVKNFYGACQEVARDRSFVLRTDPRGLMRFSKRTSRRFFSAQTAARIRSNTRWLRSRAA